MDDGFCLRYESSVTMEYGAKIGHSLFTIEHRDELECVPNHDRQPPDRRLLFVRTLCSIVHSFPPRSRLG